MSPRKLNILQNRPKYWIINLGKHTNSISDDDNNYNDDNNGNDDDDDDDDDNDYDDDYDDYDDNVKGNLEFCFSSHLCYVVANSWLASCQ